MRLGKSKAVKHKVDLSFVRILKQRNYNDKRYLLNFILRHTYSTHTRKDWQTNVTLNWFSVIGEIKKRGNSGHDVIPHYLRKGNVSRITYISNTKIISWAVSNTWWRFTIRGLVAQAWSTATSWSISYRKSVDLLLFFKYLAANCWPVFLCRHRRTVAYFPLEQKKQAKLVVQRNKRKTVPTWLRGVRFVWQRIAKTNRPKVTVHFKLEFFGKVTA